MVLIRNDLLDRLPTPFSGKSSCEIPFATMFVFILIHVMHSRLISRLPSAYECIMPFQHNLYKYIDYAYILKFKITPHVIQQYQPSPKLAHLSKSQSHPMAYRYNYILYNCDIMLVHKVHALTYPFPHKSSHSLQTISYT